MKMHFRRKNNRLPNYPSLKSLAAVVLVTIWVFSACGKGNEPTDSEVVLALINCTLIDGTGVTPVPNATLVLSSGLIVAAGPTSSTTIPNQAQVIDVGGATVLPGFFNAHIHSGFNIENLKAWAHAGVTTVRDLAGPSSFAWKEEISKNPYCAQLVAAGPMISVSGGYPLVPWGSPYMLPVNSVEDAQNKVAQLLEAGADVIKLAVESGESFQRTIPSLTPEQALAVVNTAHEYGTIATAHVLVVSDLARALESGVDDIAHMVVDNLPDSLIDLMVSDSILWIPTLELWHHVGNGLRDVAIGNLRKFVLAGGLVALGTDFDGYNSPFQLGMPVHEMEWMIEAGMSSMQIIVAGTRNAARACNRLDDLGTLEAGKIADVLVVNGDPLADIHSLVNVRLIIHRGVIIRNLESSPSSGRIISP